MLGTCISCTVNMSDQIKGVVWCSSGIIFGSCCDGGLWLVQVECVPFYPIMAHLEAGNNHYQMLKWETLELFHHRELVLVLWYTVLLPVKVIPMILLSISLVKLWILFISVVETLVIFSGG